MNTPKGFISDSIIALLKDEEALKSLQDCKTPEECYDVVKDKVSVSFDDFTSMMTIAKALMSESNQGLLSEDDLESVAGGKMDADIIVETAAVTSSSIPSAASAAS